MKKRKGLLLTVIFAAVLVADLALFGPQILALALGLPHGFHLDVHGIRFHTPMFYMNSTGSAYDEYDFTTMPSATRHKNAMITVDFKKQPTGLIPQPFSQETQQKMGLRLVNRRDVVLAGRTGNCFEYTDEFGMAYIQCFFGSDLRTSFMGSRNSIDDFYIFMSKAEELPRKT